MVMAEATDTAAQPADPWLELSLICDAADAEAVAELFANYEFNQGVVIEAADGLVDGAEFVVAPQRPLTVRAMPR